MRSPLIYAWLCVWPTLGTLDAARTALWWIIVGEGGFRPRVGHRSSSSRLLFVMFVKLLAPFRRPLETLARTECGSCI